MESADKPNPQAERGPPTEAELLRERSGTVRVNSRLVSFLYELMRGHVTPGRLERVMHHSEDPDITYSNGWLALYAQDLADRLQAPVEEPLLGQTEAYQGKDAHTPEELL